MNYEEGNEDFPSEDIQMIIKTSINNILCDVMYNSSKINDWSNSIIESILKALQSLNRPFKYVVTAVFVQKNGGGLVNGCATYWDGMKDGICKVTWENETIHGLITVYGLCVHVESPSENL